MQIIVRVDSKSKKIFWRGISPEKLSKIITNALKVKKDCNIVPLLMIIAQMSIKISPAITFQAIVEKNIIKIYCFSKAGKEKEKEKGEVIQFDGGITPPESLKETIISAVIISVEKMEIGSRRKTSFLALLEERKRQIIAGKSQKLFISEKGGE